MKVKIRKKINGCTFLVIKGKQEGNNVVKVITMQLPK